MIKKHIKSTNLEMTDAIYEYMDKKINDLQKFIHNFEDISTKIELGKTTNHHHKGNIFHVEIDLKYGDHKFRAEATTDDLYRSIDTVRDELVAEITKSNKRGRDMIKMGRQKIKELLKAER